MALVVAPQAVPQVVASDPDDDHVLAGAVTVGADLIASGESARPAAIGQL